VARSFRDLPLRMKLRRLTLYTTAGALAVACLMIIAVELVSGWRQTTRHLSLIVETVANNVRSALVFDDPRFAREALTVLEIDRRVRFAVLYRPDGEILASFQRPGLTAGEEMPRSEAQPGTDLWERTLTVVYPVYLHGEVVGTIVVRADIEEYLRSSARFAIIAFVVTLLGALVAYPLWVRMQRMISGPMLDLVDLVQQVADTGDYGLRATEQGEDELGRLIKGVNHMLEQIQARDSELEQHRRLLEEQVRERTGELLAANESLEREVSERRATEADLERFKTTLDQTLDGVVMFDPVSQAIFYANRGAAEQTGVPVEELRTRCFSSLFTELPRSLLDGMLDQVVSDPLHGVTFDAEVPRGDADRLSAEVFLQYVEPAKGEGRCLAILRDVSLQKAYERALKLAKEEAENASEAKGQFLANMSHEIRTPMNAIIGFSRLAMASGLGEKPHDYVANILHSATSLMGIIDDILDLSKIEAERLTIEQTEFDLPMLLERVLRLVAIRAEQKGLELLCAASADLPAKLIGDPLRLQQVLINLLGNAVKFTESGWARLGVDAESAAEGEVRVKFSVRDTGIGIPEDRLSELFEPFSQADVSHSRRFGGTGLGLAISRRLVELMGGDLQAGQALGGGSEFKFALPFVFPAGAEASASEAPSLDGCRILVIEGCGEAAALIEATLAGEGGSVTVVADCEKLAALPFDRIEVAVVDGKTCGRRRPAVLEALFCAGRDPGVAAVWMTGAHDPESEGCPPGARVRTLHKPVCPSALLRAIRALISGDVGPSTERGLFGDEAASSPERFAGARVLVVEDIEVNQRIVEEFLVRLGVEVDVAASGNEALDQLQHRTYDLVLMDLQMPGMDGYETTAAIRREEGLEDLPVVAMTAGASSADRERCFSAGMNDHLTKPIEPHALLAVLDTWIGPVSSSSASRLSGDADPQLITLLESAPPDLDLWGALQRLGGNGRLLLDLLGDFLERFRFAAADVEAELKSGRTAGVAEKLHGLKGVAGNLGLTAVDSAAGRLEAVLGEEGEDAENALSSLRSALDRVCETLEPVLAERASTPESDHGPTDIEIVKRLLAELREHLQTGNFAALEVVPELRRACGGHFGPQLATLAADLHELRFSEAEASLDEWELLIERGEGGAPG